MNRRITQGIGVLVCLILLGGCSVSLGYRYIDVFIAWQVDDYVTWDKQQAELFEARVDRLVDWHQSTQLLEYTVYLESIKQDVLNPVTDIKLQEHHQQLAGFSRAVIEESYPDIAHMLSLLSEAQVVEVEQALQKQLQKLIVEYIEPSEGKLAERRKKRIQKAISRWVGRLNKEQLTLLDDWNKHYKNGNSFWLKDRKNWNSAFITVLEDRKQEDFSQKLEPLFFDQGAYQSPEFRETLLANTQNNYDLIKDIQGSLTSRQTKHLEKELDKWIRQFNRLAIRSKPQKVAEL